MNWRWRITTGLTCMTAACLLLILNIPCMKTWFYIFAWWPLILTVDGINVKMTGHSPFSHGKQPFILTALLSVLIWLVFELFNLRLQNWSYFHLPSSWRARWLGYFLAFSSVSPALFEFSHFYRHVLFKKKIQFFSLKINSRSAVGWISCGLLFLFLTVIFPRIFFPLVWLGFIFLLEPVNYYLKNDSLLHDITENDWARIFSWLTAGLTAGFCWELLNFWAGTHWEYSLPYLDFGRIFQMPVCGFLGFLPFALEVFAMNALLQSAARKLKKKPVLKFSAAAALLGLYGWIFSLMDKFTVVR